MLIDGKEFARDPVFRENGKWYFWDETWAGRHGPFPDENEARVALCCYCTWLEDEAGEDRTPFVPWEQVVIITAVLVGIGMAGMIVYGIYLLTNKIT